MKFVFNFPFLFLCVLIEGRGVQRVNMHRRKRSGGGGGVVFWQGKLCGVAL